MFSDNDILKQTVKNGFIDEEWFDIMLKIAQSIIGFDLVGAKTTESNDNNKTTNIDNKENTPDDLRSDYYTVVI